MPVEWAATLLAFEFQPTHYASKFTFHPRTLFKCFDSKFRRSPLSPGIPQQALFSMKALWGFG
jgi:hypothetical protein